MEDGFRFTKLKPHYLASQGVHYYWLLHDQGLNESKAELLLPDGSSEIVFNRNGESYKRWIPNSFTDENFSGKSYIAVGNGKSVMAQRLNTVNMVGVKLSTTLLNNIIGIPLAELSNAPVFLDDLGHVDLLMLDALLKEELEDNDIQQLLDGFFLGKLIPSPNSAYHQAVQQIYDSWGCINVKALTDRLNINYSTLERSFTQYSGMSPKKFQKMVRFRNCFHDLEMDPKSFLWQSKYLDWGYYDQNHFIREFKSFTGSTPMGFFSKKAPCSIDIALQHLEEDLTFS